MHQPESVREIETHKILCDLEILMDDTILMRRPELALINKKEIVFDRILLFQQIIGGEKEKKAKNRQILGPCLKRKKTVEYVGESDTNCVR